ncbi:LOW QUALITY PROTEIN: hypothetical protein JCM24511_02131 [Saitozyma sp. JCM 24511]|nr:LOW QUALITY PROTEIN: hypothetical protein JCM24511_02131 [Saitozyma sp. JCM 24511]
MFVARLLLVASLAAPIPTRGLGESRCITFPLENAATELQALQHTSQYQFGSNLWSAGFLLASETLEYAAPLLLDSGDDEAIHLAASTFADDIQRVTGQRPVLYNDSLPQSVDRAIVIGTRSSRLVQLLQDPGANDVHNGLSGMWEAYDCRVIQKPLASVQEALLIVGSDRRGTIYAMYTLSEQIGMSPFHFWSDSPVRRRQAVAFGRDKILAHGEPTVKYRGLFINDEHPAMWDWAQQRWKIPPQQPVFMPEFHKLWFEMMLRLKANYFWPAMHASMFSADGVYNSTDGSFPEPPSPGPNQILAQRMGIIMGTSHHEPMGRNKPEWDRAQRGAWDWKNNTAHLRDWWTYGAERAQGLETMFTLGMRGDGDEPLTGASKEQDILREVYGTSDISNIPQVWCMYKEIADYYADGMEIPDDVSILFSDDNWGNLMSVLPPSKSHKGGAGLYYHLDYVGLPRSYKWINTINLVKMWEQLSLARAFDTTQIWIANIGTLKPLELPTEFFLALAWDLDAWPTNSVRRFHEEWAEREFGWESAGEVGDIMLHYGSCVLRVQPDRFRAESVLAEWDKLVTRAGAVYSALDVDTKPAFFQQVYLLCMMQENLNRLHLAVGRSNLHAFQAKTAANRFAQEAIEAFHHDANLTDMIHGMLGRKWDHPTVICPKRKTNTGSMFDQAVRSKGQIHINYNYLLEPMKDSLPAISFVNPMVPARQGIPPHVREYGCTSYTRVTVENSYGAWPGDTPLNCPYKMRCPDPTLFAMDPYGVQTRWVDLGSSGPMDVQFSATCSHAWLRVSVQNGTILRDASTDMRLIVSVDWNKTGDFDRQGFVHISLSDGNQVNITVPIRTLRRFPPEFRGFVEGDGYVVMESGHFHRNLSVGSYAFQELKGYGRTLSGLEMFPMTDRNFSVGTGPHVAYDFWLHDYHATADITIQIGPSLNMFGPDKPLALGIQLDTRNPTTLLPVPVAPLGSDGDGAPPAIGALPVDWMRVVATEVRNVTMRLEDLCAGQHTLTLWGMTTGIVVERIWVDVGGIEERGYSYLGPPESYRN